MVQDKNQLHHLQNQPQLEHKIINRLKVSTEPLENLAQSITEQYFYLEENL